MTGLWAFEVRMPYQKYQGPAIVVRLDKNGKEQFGLRIKNDLGK